MMSSLFSIISDDDNEESNNNSLNRKKKYYKKKAYELATLTGTQVMLLIAYETGHVYTYATPKLQPMITSEVGKTLIERCLAKDQPPIEFPSTITTLNNNDILISDENQRTNVSIDNDMSNEIHSPKPIKLITTDEIKQMNTSSFLSPLTTVARPLTCLINSDSQQQSISNPTSFTINLNSLKTTEMNFLFTPSPISSQPSPLSNIPFVLTLGNSPYPIS